MTGRVLFVTWDGGGNVPPTVTLAGRLAARGVDVSGFGPPSLAARFGAEGVGYRVRESADPWDPGIMAREVAGECDRAGAGAVVVDYMLPGALLGVAAAGRTGVALVHTLYGALLADGAPNPMGMAASVDGLAAVCGDLGLEPVTRMGDVLDRCARVLVTSPAALDARRGSWAGNVRHVGPVLEGPGADAGWRPPAGVDARPLVVVSLGTTPMGEGPVLQRVFDALAGEPVAVLALLGAHLDPAGLQLPANAVTSGYVRHAAVLPHAAVTVCHGGLGTVLASLAAGVPVVCLPLGREQPDNAAAVERARAGRAVDPGAGPDAVRDAVAAVRADPAYRRAAAALAATMAPPGAPTAAEDEVLSLL